MTPFNPVEAQQHIAEARKAATAVYVAVEAPVAYDLSRILTGLASDLESAVEHIAGLEKAVGYIRDLHSVEKRYQSSPDSEESYDTAEQVAREQDIALADVTFFEVCAECGRIEMDMQDDWDERAYKESLWPCATAIRLALSAPAPTEPEKEN